MIKTQKENSSRFKKGHKLIGRKATIEQRKKQSLAQMGRIISQKTKEKISRGNLGKKKSLSHKENLSRALTGRKQSKEHIEKRTAKIKGIKRTKEFRESRSGDKCHLWKGGITSINQKIRSSHEYKLWREAVFQRDKWTCVWCGIIGQKLNADHIKPFALYPELRFAIDNGRTLCKNCHLKTDTWGGRTR